MKMLVLIFIILGLPAWVFAGDIDSPGVPSAGSGMYTLQQLYNYLNLGTEPPIPGSFQEPSAGPGPTMKTTKNIYDDTKFKFDQCDAQASDVAAGKKFFSTLSGNWGMKTGSGLISSGTAVVGNVLATKTFSNSSSAGLTGTMPTNTLSAANDTVSAGYYAATTLSTVDSDLTGANIVSGKTIFGKAGSAVAATGTAVVDDVLATKTFSNSSSTGLTGAMPTNTLTAANDTVSAGYYAATTLSTVDSDLASANIMSGKTIFGFAGDSNVVNTSSGDAAAGDILINKKAWVDGSEITGSVSAGSNVSGADGSKTFTIPDGLYSASKTATANDSDLTAGNIKKDVQIFGVTGTYEGGITYQAGVAKTGQTTSYLTGDDGDLEKGVAWPSPRFTDNGDGTVTDNLTGLMWTTSANPATFTKNWTEALTYCNGLTLGVYTDWRLPNIKELLSLLDWGNSSPALPSSNPFTDVVSNNYWSSTAADVTNAWAVHVGWKGVSGFSKTEPYRVWPVRGGQQ